jgi:predicted nuclease of predicted toxin-antitoxin system
LLIDEDTQNRLLVHLLRTSGHDVLTVNEVALMGEPDSVVLDFARENNRILLTRNCKDFQALHQANPNHFGILGIYHDRNFSKDMSVKSIVRAISNLEVAKVPLANQFISLNQWNY